MVQGEFHIQKFDVIATFWILSTYTFYIRHDQAYLQGKVITQFGRFFLGGINFYDAIQNPVFCLM